MNLDKWTFVIIALALISGFFRCVYIQFAAWNYMRKNHYDFWLEHIGGVSRFGWQSVFNQSNQVDDPNMAELAIQFQRNIKQLLLIALACVLLAALRIAFKEIAGI